MNEIIDILKEINIGQLLAIGAMFWIMYGRLDRKIDKLDEKLTNRIDKLSEKIEDIDRRLCRIEGSLATKGHCLIDQSTIQRKVE